MPKNFMVTLNDNYCENLFKNIKNTLNNDFTSLSINDILTNTFILQFKLEKNVNDQSISDIRKEAKHKLRLELRNIDKCEDISNFLFFSLNHGDKDFATFIIKNYVYNNKFIMDVLLFRKHHDRRTFLCYLNKKIEREKSKFCIPMDKILSFYDNKNENNNDTFEFLFHHGINNCITINVTEKDKDNNNLLTKAVFYNNIKFVNYILDYANANGINLNIMNKMQTYIIHY